MASSGVRRLKMNKQKVKIAAPKKGKSGSGYGYGHDHGGGGAIKPLPDKAVTGKKKPSHLYKK